MTHEMNKCQLLYELCAQFACTRRRHERDKVTNKCRALGPADRKVLQLNIETRAKWNMLCNHVHSSKVTSLAWHLANALVYQCTRKGIIYEWSSNWMNKKTCPFIQVKSQWERWSIQSDSSTFHLEQKGKDERMQDNFCVSIMLHDKQVHTQAKKENASWGKSQWQLNWVIDRQRVNGKDAFCVHNRPLG